MQIRFNPSRAMIARWLIGIGIALGATVAFGQEPAPADPIAQARAAAAAKGTPANRLALADLLFRRAEHQLGQATHAASEAHKPALLADATRSLAEAADQLAPALTQRRADRAACIEQAEAAAAEEGNDPAPVPAELESELQQVWLLEGQVRLLRGELALAAAGDDPTAQRAAKQQLLAAISSCSELEWEYDGWYVAYWAHITAARSYGALGRSSDALAGLRSVLALPKDPATAAVRTEAYRRLAELQLRGDRYAEAVDTFVTAATDYPDLLATRRGQSLQLLAGRAHAGSGNPDQAVGAALNVIEAERSLHYREAMDRLADWAAQWPDAPARIRYLQGDALYHQARAQRTPDRFLAAIEAYQAAAHSAGRDPETKQYALTAWRAIASCYEALDRYVEAAHAYDRGAKRVDLDPAAAAECAFRCYRAWRRAVELDDTPVNRDAMRQARARLISQFPDVQGADDLSFYAARDLEKQGKFLQAAQAYDAVPAGSDKQAEALARAGGCYFREFARRSERARESQGRLSPSDTALLSEAERRCTAFLALPGGAIAARALATFYLGRVASERGDHAGVVTRYRAFDELYGASQSKLTSDVLYLCVRAAASIPDSAAAEDALARLVAHDPRSDNLRPACLETAKVIDAEGDRPARAAELYLRWLAHTPDASAGARLGVAIRVRRVAEIILPDQAPQWWSRAAELLRPLLAAPGELSEEQQASVVDGLWQCERALARAHSTAGEPTLAIAAWERGEPLIDVLYRARPGSPSLAEAYLRCLRELVAGERGDAAVRGKRLGTARALCGQLIRGRKQFAPGWWQAKEWLFEILFAQGEYRMVRDLIDNMRLMAPQLGGEAMRERLLELRRKAADLAGARAGK